MPPAKSSAPIWPSQPAGLPSAPAAQTQWASGSYTNVAHRRMNRQYGPNRTRSAIAPEIRAGVMMANIPWYMQWMRIGTWVPGKTLSYRSGEPRPRNSGDQPNHPACEAPKAML